MKAYRGSALSGQVVAPKKLTMKKLRALVFARAGGQCEACGRDLGESGHLDHAFGRAKAEGTLDNCWALCLVCDENKTRNHPSAAEWCCRFHDHATKLGYLEAAERAAAKAQVQIAKGFAA